METLAVVLLELGFLNWLKQEWDPGTSTLQVQFKVDYHVFGIQKQWYPFIDQVGSIFTYLT